MVRTWRLRPILIIAVGLLLVGTLYFGVNMDYRVEQDQGVVVIDWLMNVTIPIQDITSIKILDKAPGMRKTFGASLLYVRQGTFYVNGIGRVKMYAGDIRRKLVLIYTKDAVYGITPKDAAQFVAQLPPGLLE